MTRTHWTKEDIMETLKSVHIGGLGVVKIPQDVVNMIMYVERLFYTKHIKDIQARQDKLENLWQDENRFLAFWFNNDRHKFSDLENIIAPGCYACLFEQITHVRHSSKCSQDCEFCYYKAADSPHSSGPIGKNLYNFSGVDMDFTVEEAKLLLTRQAMRCKAIGWLQKEPLEELDSIQPIMEKIAKLGIHQYMYTNGVHASPDALNKLASWGLNEIRFNLQSTDFSQQVLDRMKYAKEVIRWVLIETPMYSKSYNNFIDNREAIIEAGVDQINVPELQICSLSMVEHFVETEGPVYKHRRGYVSPISSRHYVYDLIEFAEEENWPVTINDCSNDTKFFRGVFPNAPVGHIGYESAFELPFDHVMYLVEQVLEDGVEYEFF